MSDSDSEEYMDHQYGHIINDQVWDGKKLIPLTRRTCNSNCYCKNFRRIYYNTPCWCPQFNQHGRSCEAFALCEKWIPDFDIDPITVDEETLNTELRQHYQSIKGYPLEIDKYFLTIDMVRRWINHYPVYETCQDTLLDCEHLTEGPIVDKVYDIPKFGKVVFNGSKWTKLTTKTDRVLYHPGD